VGTPALQAWLKRAELKQSARSFCAANAAASRAVCCIWRTGRHYGSNERVDGPVACASYIRLHHLEQRAKAMNVDGVGALLAMTLWEQAQPSVQSVQCALGTIGSVGTMAL